jgi:hypothetical protein
MRITASVNSAPWLILLAFCGAEPLSALARQKVAYASTGDERRQLACARSSTIGGQLLTFYFTEKS